MLSYFIVLLTISSLVLTKDAPSVPVQPFQPKPIHYTLNDLPAPYNTSSAQKPAIVVGVPKNATLLVADSDFHVTIYRDNLKAPRHMIYTPTGEILVTVARGSQISILSGDQTDVFADASNAISQAFGMAFVEVCSLSRSFSG